MPFEGFSHIVSLGRQSFYIRVQRFLLNKPKIHNIPRSLITPIQTYSLSSALDISFCLAPIQLIT